MSENIENKAAKVVLRKYSVKMNFHIIQSLKVNMNEKGIISENSSDKQSRKLFVITTV